jgi:hypothetical protein
MYYSEKYKILIVGIPKTGTMTIQDAMLNLDSKGLIHGITINGLQYSPSSFPQGIMQERLSLRQYLVIRSIIN